MNLPAEPFYIPDLKGDLFALYQAPLAPSRRQGIVICNPLPQQMMRAQQALVQLMRSLAEAGFSVLRFDYLGTGDSTGTAEQWSLATWQENIKTALSTLSKRAEVDRISLCGLGLGASLALKLSETTPLTQLVLWDPIIDGKSALHRLEQAHQLMLTRQPYEAPRPSLAYQAAQCFGFAWPSALQQELSSLQTKANRTLCSRIDLITSETGPEWNELALNLQKAGAEVHSTFIDQPLYWEDDRFLKLRCFPSVHLKSIIQAFRGDR